MELVRSIYAAWERGYFGETHWVDPEIDFQAIGDTPSAGRWKGLDGMATGWREWLSAGRNSRWRPTSIGNSTRSGPRAGSLRWTG